MGWVRGMGARLGGRRVHDTVSASREYAWAPLGWLTGNLFDSLSVQAPSRESVSE